MKKINKLIAFLVILNILFSNVLSVEAASKNVQNISKPRVTLLSDAKKATGLRLLTEKDRNEIKKRTIKITNVKPNKIGLDRINENLLKKGKSKLKDIVPAVHGDELVTTKALSLGSTGTTGSVGEELPTAVDNSTRKYFPPIGNQGAFGSCAPFAGVYYEMTYMYGLARALAGNDDWDVKTDVSKIFSPKWTYNFLNSGNGGYGTWITDGWDIIKDQGVPTMGIYPYDNDASSWSSDPAVWRSALNYRTNPWQSINVYDELNVNTPVLDVNDAQLLPVKQMLNNGYIFNFGTYVYSWKSAVAKNDPSTTLDDNFAGKNIYYMVDGSEGGHAMTIVGYDDNVWVDINNNNIVDTGEKGIFKIANSWGTSYDDAGFRYITYDALNKVSAVPNVPYSSTRQPAFWENNSLFFVTAKSSYEPEVTAEFNISHSDRSQICSYDNGIKFAVQDAIGTEIGSFTPKAFNSSSTGYLSFDGTNNVSNLNFVVDLTGLKAVSGLVDPNNINYVAKFDDKTLDNKYLNLSNAKINDSVAGMNKNATNVPINIDGTKATVVFNQYIDNIPPSIPTNLYATKETLNTVELAWDSSVDDFGMGVQYNLYNYGVKVNSTLITGNYYTVSGLDPSRDYCFTVKSVDVSANESLASKEWLVNISKKKTLFIVGDTNLNVADQKLLSRLNNNGYTVITKASASVSLTDATGMNVVVISSSAKDMEVGGKFRTSVVPVVVMLPAVYDDMHMTGIESGINFGTGIYGGEENELMRDSGISHPVSKNQKFTFSSSLLKMGWGSPTNESVILETAPGLESGKAFMFTYEKGASLTWEASPSRRVGLFIQNETILSVPVGPDCLEWFDTAVNWAAYKPINLDRINPSQPLNVRSNFQTDTSIGLSWDNSTDNVGVEGYYIIDQNYRILNLNSPTTSTNYTINGLDPNTTYTFNVMAIDKAYNWSVKTPVTVKTMVSNPAVMYEAENATLSGANVSNVNTGYTGTGYADYTNESGDYVEFSVNALTSGTYKLDFRYSNGASAQTDRPLSLKVNGTVVNTSLSFPATANWTTWATVTKNVSLNAGLNTVRLTTIGSNGGNVDSLTVTSVVTPTPTPTPTNYVASEDSYVRASNATTNYGDATTMDIKGSTISSYIRTAYLKFSLTNLTNVSSAKIRFYVSAANSFPITVYGLTDDSWTEAGITWNNQPNATGAVNLGAVNITTTGWYTLDVTSFVSGQMSANKIITLQLKDMSLAGNTVSIGSSEGTNKPYLSVAGN